MQQASNNNLAQFAQMMAQRYGITPPNLVQPQMPRPQGMPPQGQQPPQQGMPQNAVPQRPPQMPPQGGPMPPQGSAQPQGQPQGPQGMAQQPGGQKRFTPAEMAALGRMGDSTVAHLTPGEIEVPPQVQTPKVLATLKKAFEAKGVPPQNFVAGSPSSSVNPNTGAPEYSFWSSFLPIAMGVGGSLVAPGIGTALGSSMGGAALGAIGGAAGTGVGDVATGHSLMQSALGAAGAGAGGYFAGGGTLGGLGIGGSSASDAATKAALNPMSGGMQAVGQSAGQAGTSAGQGASSLWNQANPGFNSLYGALPQGSSLSGMAGVAAGGMLGNSIGAPPKSTGPVYPPGFTTPATPVSQLPSAQQQLGYNTYQGPSPNFTGYNPATNNPAAYNFFPTTSATGT